jgi:hypothetical protein
MVYIFLQPQILKPTFMKKFYSLLATVVISATMSAQGSESFTNLTATTSSYTAGSYAGDNGISWTYAAARKVSATDNVTGTSIGFSDTGTRKVSANSGVNGVGTLNYKVRSYFTGGVAADRTMEVYVNGIKQETFTLAAMNTTYSRSLPVNITGNVVIEFRSTGSKQIVLDDVSWTAATATLGVADIKTNKSLFVKNTFAEEEIFFNGKSDIKVYSRNGELVKTASVSDSKSLNISALPKGMYIITGVVDGKNVSEKIIKK